ncbi:MAG: hypothetical protein H7Y14_10095 [Burkholderiales bacterium]|nr:hypothetical protein [Burkholderiales bacterium]
MQSCSLYGLGVHVNVPIAGLAGLPEPRRVDVRIAVGVEPPDECDESEWRDYYASPERDSRGVHHIRVSRRARPDRYRVAYEDGTRIYLDAANVWAVGPEGASVEDTATYLLGPTLGFVLRLRGITCLHASAIAVGGRAVAIVAPSGFGKSSLAAAMAQRGHAVLTDDVAALFDGGDRFEILPAYPRIRLWPASVEALFGSDDALPRITPTWDKRFLALDGARFRFQPESLPLAAIYLVADRDPAAGGPRVEDVGGRDALIGLVANTYTTYLLDKDMRAREFEVLGRLSRAVPVRRAVPAVDIGRIGELCDAIEASLDV